MAKETISENDNIINLIARGFEVASGLEKQSGAEHIKFDKAPSASLMADYSARSQILQLTAERLREHLNFLRQRLFEIGNPKR